MGFDDDENDNVPESLYLPNRSTTNEHIQQQVSWMKKSTCASKKNFWTDVMVPYAAYISPCNIFLLGGRLYYGLYMRDPQRGYGCQQGLYTYVGDARLKTHYPHGQMHVVALLVTYMYLVPAYLGYSISRTPIFGSAPLCSV